jgi:hypothetical protein
VKQRANGSLPNESEYYTHHLFYDDLAAIAKTACDLQRALRVLNIIGEEHNFKTSTVKTKVMAFNCGSILGQQNG